MQSNRWYYVAISHTAGGGGTYYLNGVADGATNETDPTSDANPICLGMYCATSLYHWNGKFDDVRIYNRALSAGEVKQLYNMGR